MGKSKKTTETQQTTTPAARPELQFALGQNRELFNTLSNRGPAPFSTVTPFSAESEAAFDLTTQRALAGNPAVQAGQDAVTDIAGEGFLGSASPFISEIAGGEAANPFLSSVAEGGIDNAFVSGLAEGEANPFISNLASGKAANPAAAYFEPTARGDFLDFGSNPAFQQGLETINENVGSIFERAGRTGSGQNQSAVASGAADLAGNIFNQERANQLAASQALANINQQGASNALNAQGLIGSQGMAAADLLNRDQFNRALTSAGLANQDVGNALNAAGVLGSDAGARLSAAGLSPEFGLSDFRNLEALRSVGAAKEGKAGEEIADQLYRFNFPFENQIQATQLLNAGTGGLGPLLGGTTERDTVETQNPGILNSVLGGLLTAGSLAAGGPAAGAAGAAGAGGAGALFPFFSGFGGAPPPTGGPI